MRWSLTSTVYAPMCWVMPPASRSTTCVSRMASSNVVFAVVDVTHHGHNRCPWDQVLILDGSRLDRQHFVFERAHLDVGAELPGHHGCGLVVQRRVDGEHQPALDQLLQDVLGAEAELLGQVLDGHPLGKRNCAGDRRRRRLDLRHQGTHRTAFSRAGPTQRRPERRAVADGGPPRRRPEGLRRQRARSSGRCARSRRRRADRPGAGPWPCRGQGAGPGVRGRRQGGGGRCRQLRRRSRRRVATAMEPCPRCAASASTGRAGRSV